MKSFLLSRQAIHRISLLSSKTPTFCRNFSAITSTISHSDRHLRSYDEQTPFQNVEIPRPISSFNRYFHFTRESRLSESSAAIDDSNDQEEDDEDGTTNEFLSRFVWIMRGKVSEAYPDCDKKMIDGMLLLIVEKVVEEIERGGFNKVGSAPPSPSSEFSDDLWATIWEVSNTVLKDMEKERKKEKMKQYVQSPEVMEMCRFAGEIGIRGDLLRELRFKWAREKMDDAEFYESLEQQRDLDNSIRESETVDGEVEEEGFVPSDEVESRSISLPKRKGKLKYKIYGLELSDPKWVEMADKIHEAEEEADWREPKPVTGKCKLVMEKLESLQEGDDPSGLLAEWAELLEPNRVDWIALINQLREGNTHAYLKVAEGVLDEKSFNASISDYSKLIHIHAKENHIEDVERILKKMSQNGIFPDILTATALVHMYSKSGNFERATEAFENLKSYGLRPDEKIYEAMILGYVNAGKPKLGERLMKEMQAKELKASEEVYMALLRAYAQMGDANGAAGISSSMQYASGQQRFDLRFDHQQQSLQILSAHHFSTKPILLYPMPMFYSSRFLFFFTIVPLLVSIALYQLDTFDPAPVPSEAYASSTTSIPPLISDKYLTGAEFIGVGLLDKPEDIAYHQDSNLIYTGCIDGWVKRVSVHDSANDSVVEDWVNTGGRPLGIAFGVHGEVIVADAYKGLLNISGDGKKTELLTDQAEGVKFKLTDVVAVADNGVLYFTDASYKYTLHQVKFDILEGKPHGRLMSFDPTTRVTRVLLKDLYFANGVSMSPDQTHLIFCETPMRRCSKYYINEERVEVFIQGLPGYPDNIRYDGDGHYWIAMVSGASTLWRLSMKYPFLRKITAIAAKYGVELMFMKNAGVLQVDLDGNPIAYYHDQRLSHITTGIKIGNYLYCGNILHSYIIRLDLLKYPAQKKKL